ncbi:hypothetical protein Vretimale_3114 [Volvox reticuliferus]|uniref:ubiquitinyl hydrolase 1 n=1 Tax=Volvox reticuliferus TaxID=1737510 RepID=A0A8J4CDN7_9CHLO|nr:hypothetical protein Vretifemale_6570 [Volvox reticuliferus]GIL97471.1 hypothetical protein Vretimale_3114 [Volvox reticuliferus]
MDYPAYHERQKLQMCLKHTLNNLLQHEAFVAADLDTIANTLTQPSMIGLSRHRTPILGNYDINVLEVALQRYDKVLTWLPQRPQVPKPPPCSDPQLPRTCACAAGASVRSGKEEDCQNLHMYKEEGQQEEGEEGKHQPLRDEVQQWQPPQQGASPQQASSTPWTDREPVETSQGSGKGGPSSPGLWLHDVLSRPDLWALIINVAHPPAFPPLRWLLSGLGAGGRHWLGLRRLGGIWYNLDSHLPHPQPFEGEEAVCEFLQRALDEKEATILLVIAAPSGTTARQQDQQ